MRFDFSAVPAEVPLANAPLVRVLCQIRFAPVPELVDEASERALAALLHGTYPVRGTVQGIVLPLPGVELGPSRGQELFRTFEDPDGHWKATVAPDFVSLETDHYERREGFLERLSELMSALVQVQRPARVTRVGLRYTDRIEDPQGLQDLVHPALLGLLPFLSDPENMRNQVTQTLLTDPDTDVQVQVRSLCLPPDVSFDGSIAAVSVRSWVLDIDAFTESRKSFDTPELTATVGVLAERAYQVFHWSVTDHFRKQFGGELGDGETNVDTDA